MLEPVRKKSVAQQVFTQLRRHILDGTLEPGDALPAERVLAEQLNVNRQAVREGLKRLEQAGLVAIRQGGATKVLDYTRTAGLELLASLIVRGDGTIDVGVARGVLELRTDLAPIVAGRCVDRADDDVVERLRDVVAQMKQTDDAAELQRLALDFWALVVEGTKNPALQLAFNSLESVYGNARSNLTHVLEQEFRAVDDYEALVEAVAAGQKRKAQTRATKIVERGAQALEGVLVAVEAAQAAAG